MDIMLFIFSLFISVSILVTTVASFAFLAFVFFFIRDAFSKKKVVSLVVSDFVSAESRLAI